MPNVFNFSVSPFDCLTQSEQGLVRSEVNIAYFRPGEVLQEVGSAPAHLFVLIKGFVQQFEESGELLATYGPEDSFDGRGLVSGRSASRFVAVDEVLAYELARETVNALIARNDTFSALLFSALGRKLSTVAVREADCELQSLNMARVADAYVRHAHTVPAQMDIVSVVQLFQEARTTNVLVRDDEACPARLGIFTTTGLQRAILSGRALASLPVGDLASWDLLTVSPDDQVGEALALMVRHGVHRVVVRQAGQVCGILESLDLFSFLSNHSMLISRQLQEATSLEALEKVSEQVTAMVRRQYRAGVRVGLLARLVQDLNGRLFERVWQLVAPPALVQSSCLLVMGSEGRGEQLLKTDQDNALLLEDGCTLPAAMVSQACEHFSAALARLGYPPCPGSIMVSNPAWRMSLATFEQRIRRWLLLPEADSLMNLAIVLDAHAICGQVRLLQVLRRRLFAMLSDNDALLARFAQAVDAFGDNTRWWQRMLGGGEASFNLKKAGIFPIVHGVRSLALASRIAATGTGARLQALVQAGVLSKENGQDLTEALHFFMGLRLKAGLEEMDLGQPVSGKVWLERLTPLERDLLKDALGEVRRFRAQLRLRFRFGAVS